MRSFPLVFLLLKVFLVQANAGSIQKRSILEDFDPCDGEFLYDITLHCTLPLDNWAFKIQVDEYDGWGEYDILSEEIQQQCTGTTCRLLVPFKNEPTFWEIRDIEISFRITHSCTYNRSIVWQKYGRMNQHKCRNPSKKIEKTVDITLDSYRLYDPTCNCFGNDHFTVRD